MIAASPPSVPLASVAGRETRRSDPEKRGAPRAIEGQAKFLRDDGKMDKDVR